MEHKGCVKHKNYEYIVAWAEGKNVQMRMKRTAEWIPLVTDVLFDEKEDLHDFCVAPSVVKIKPYIRYVCATNEGEYLVNVVFEGVEQYLWDKIEHDPYFVCWVDHEWQHSTVELK